MAFRGRSLGLGVALALIAGPVLAQQASTAPTALTGAETRIPDPVWTVPPHQSFVIHDGRHAPPVVVTLSCAVLPTGRTTGCRADDPAQAARASMALGVAASSAVLSPQTVARAAPDARVLFDVRFEAPDPNSDTGPPVPVSAPPRPAASAPAPPLEPT